METLEKAPVMPYLNTSKRQTVRVVNIPGSATKRYRVMHLATYAVPHVGGVEIHMHTLCKALAAKFDVSEAGGGGPRFRSSRQFLEGVPVTRLATPFTLRSATICPQIPLAIRANNPDLIHLHMPNPFGAAALLLSGYKGPLIVTWHFDVVRQRALNKIITPLFNKVLGRAMAIITTSPNLAKSSEILQAFSNRVRVIPYGIDYEPYERRDAEAAAFRQRYGPRIVLGVGRLVYYKGWEYLISAMSEVDASLLIIGDGPLRQNLEHQARSQGISERVHFIGERHHLIPFYQASDVFVLSSIRGEAFGLVQLEAMASGKPVINTSLQSGVPFVSRDGESGCTVPPHDSKALATAINSLLADEPLRNRYGRAGKRRVQQEFSVQAMTKSIVKVYAEALSDNSLNAPDEQASELEAD
jgi:glycosyltransferase involved in cell wall biosynthesis